MSNTPYSFWKIALLASLVGLVVYANTLFNGYALDDQVVILDNPHVQAGVAGIPGVLTTDSFEAGLRHAEIEATAGGRYRPLSLVTFAIEESIAPTLVGERLQANMMHAGNMALFVLTLILIVAFTRRLFPDSSFLPLATALLFAVHPLHVEVVANIKSRDEMLSLLLMLGMFIAFLRLAGKPRTGNLGYLLPCLLLFAALLAKEYALAAIVLVPLTTFLVAGWNRHRFLREVLTIIAAIAVYMAWRFNAVDLGVATATDPLNAPFAGMSFLTALATKLAVLAKSLGYMLFPHPLSSNHGFAVIPERSFSHPFVWIGILAHFGILLTALRLTWKRKPLAFALWFYLLTLFPVSNLLVDVGVPFAERFLYHASLGACMCIAWGLAHIPLIRRPRFAYGALAALLVFGAARSVTRNMDWRSTRTLIVKDAETCPQSVFLQQHAGVIHYNSGRFKKAIAAFNACTALYPEYAEPYPVRCLAHAKAGNIKKAIADFEISKQILFPEEIEAHRNFLREVIQATPVSTPDAGDELERLLKQLAN